MKRNLTILLALLALGPTKECWAQDHKPQNELDPGYQHASHEAVEHWRDLKYGIRIHWGLYTLQHLEASWPLRKMSDAQKAAYFNSYKKFNPVGFDADRWMQMFERCGFKFFTFTTKHHDGFSMYDTKTRVRKRVDWDAPGGPQIEDCDFAFSIMDTPYHRDIVKEICDSARRHHIAIGLYFSNIDWYDTDFRMDPNSLFYDKAYNAESDPVSYERMVHRHRAQILELERNYHPLTIGLDMNLPGISWSDITETMLQVRRAGPDVLFRDRGIEGYGDYNTPEGWVPKSPTDPRLKQRRAWMVIYPMANMFAYQPDETKYKPSQWALTNLINIVAAGGDFEPAIGPDENGRFDPVAVERLEVVGDWLKVNGEAIYGTRPWKEWKQGDDIRFTRSKDNKYVYAISLKWPGEQLDLEDVRPRAGSAIRLLGSKQPLSWHWDKSTGLVIKIPDSLQAEADRPCKEAYAFKIEVEQRSASTSPASATGSASAGSEDWNAGQTGRECGFASRPGLRLLPFCAGFLCYKSRQIRLSGTWGSCES